MKWSISASRVFAQCPRKWYYETAFANTMANDPRRKEAYLLKQLDTIYSWRGKVVDQTISKFVVPRLNAHRTIIESEVLDHADRLASSQLAFAKAQMHRNEGGKKTGRTDYCAFFEIEYGSGLADGLVNKAMEEIHASLKNFLNSHIFRSLTNEGSYLVAQRALSFQFADVSVQCTPDLIAFFTDKPPAIVDWKVQAPTHKENWLQLGVYAVALSRAKPHKDFPQIWIPKLADPTNIGLIEFQLLRDQQLSYMLSEEDVTDIEDYIYSSSLRMCRVVGGLPDDPCLIVDTLPTARFPVTCMGCRFRKDCWKEVPS